MTDQRSSSRCNVLISSAGRRVGLVDLFRESLTALNIEGHVLGCDMSRLSPAIHRSDEGFVVPPCTDPVFADAVLDICRNRDVSLIVPTIDPELPVFAAHQERFAAADVVVAASSAATIAIGSDKRRTHQWFADNHFPTVAQSTPEALLTGREAIPFPAIVKPASGSASMGVEVVGSRDELCRSEMKDVVVQAMARGDEYTIDVFNDRSGEPVCAVPRKRLEVRAGEVSKGVTVDNPRLEELAFAVCRLLPGAFAVVTLQAFLADDGDVRLIEINPRFGGGFPLSWEAGARYPQWLIEDVVGIPSSARTDCWRAGVVMLRYDEAVFLDERDL